MAYESTHRLRDGAVLVYMRSNNKHRTYQARIRVPNTGAYVVRSLKTAALSEALSKAGDLYDELRFAAKQGLDITAADLRFKAFWQKFYNSHKLSLSIHRQRLHTGNANRYFIPFFENYKVSDIPDIVIEKYWDWRLNYYAPNGFAKKSGKETPKNIAETPSQKTLDMEAGMLRQIFRWGKRMGFVKREPWIKPPKVKHTIGVTRRPAFTAEEWRKVYEYMRKWVDEPMQSAPSEKKEGRITRRGPHKLHRYQREMVRNYLLFMSNSGLRPNEARQLRWHDVHLEKDDEGREYLLVDVSPTTKTGARTVVCREGAQDYIERIRTISEHTNPTDLIFCDQKGEPVADFNKTFSTILTKLKLLTDKRGEKRTIYSLRHFYCTMSILDSDADIHFIARNMGCSISYIEKHYSHVLTVQNAKELSRKNSRTIKADKNKPTQIEKN